MLVPQSRLLWVTGLLVCPALAVMPAHPAGGTFGLAVIGAVALIAGWDALRAWTLLDGVGVEAPPVLRLVKGRPSTLPLQLRSPNTRQQHLRLALGLAPHLQSPKSEFTVQLPAGAAPPRLDWPVQAPVRGRFLVQVCHAEAISPLGLWAKRAPVPLQCEVRVQPDLTAVLRRNAIFLSRGTGGTRAQRRVGRGREFEKLRDYLPGDGVDEIHWRATAKRSHPVTKVFQVERTQEVYVVVDASRLSGRTLSAADVPPKSTGATPREDAAGEAPGVAPGGEPLLEQFIRAALVVGAVAENQGDLFGLVTFGDQVQGFVRAASGQSHYSACREKLVDLRLRMVAPDFDELAAFIRVRLRRRALLLFLTNLDDPVAADGFLRAVDLLRQQHLCAVVQPRPADAVTLYSQDSVHTLDDAYRALAGHLQWQGLREMQAVLQRRGVAMVSAPGETLATALISRYLDVKRRQLL